MDPELRIQIKKELAEREEGNKATKDLAYTGCKIKEETLLEAGENGDKKTFLDPMDLYTDHEIKDELVIGPVVVRRPINGSTNEPKVLVDPLPVDVLARFTRSKANTVLRFKLDDKYKKPNRISKEKYEDASDIRKQGLHNVFVPFDKNEIQKKIIVSFKSRAVEGDMDSEDTSQEKENPAKVLLLSENDHTSGSEDCTTGIKRKSRRGKKKAKKLKKEGSGSEDLSLQIKESLSKVLLLSEGDHSSESEDHAPAIKQKSHREKKKSKKLNNEGNGSGDEDDNDSVHEGSSAKNEDLSSDGEDCVPRIKTRSKKNKGSEKDYSEDDDNEEDDVIEESDDDYSQRKSKSKHKKDRKRDRSERTRREKRTRPRYSESSDDQESEAEGTSDSDLDQRLSDDGNQKSASASGSSEQSEDESLLQPKQVKKQIIHLNYCKVCLRGTDLLDCDSCAMAYHRKCVNAPVKKMPAGQFRCPRCSCPPIDGKVAKVLTWRWEESSSRTTARQREFFIKWDQRSYWECSWAGELQMDVYETRLYRSYMRKYDMDEPPELEAPMDERDGRFQRMQRDKAGREPVDEKSLQEKYYRYGVKPEWLMVQRVLSRRNTRPDNEFFLVKWRELSYDQATWESKYEDIPGLKDAIEYYQDMESYLKSSTSKSTRKTRKGRYNDSSDDSDSDTPLRPARPSRYKPPPDEPTTNLSDKYESQPFFVEDTGMQLKPYQLEGLNWLRYSWEQGINTILADEMGLGKTIQTVAFLYSLYKEGHCRGPFLVSVPLSTIINWEREFELWAPDLYCVTYTGAKDLRAAIRKYEFDDNSSKGRKTRTSNSQTKFHVLLTSYEFTSVDVKYLSAINWAVLVVDEAHRLKNNQSKFFRILSGYEIDYKLLLTGTPLQNNLEELFHLLNFLNKKKFKDLDVFQKEFADVAKEEQVKRLHELLGPHMLRRLKADVLKDMPTKSEFIVRVELSPMQKKFCRHILMKNFEALNSKHGGKPVTLLNLVMDLRKCCNHPYLFPLAAEEAPVDSRGNYETQTLIESSGKLVLLTKMLKRLKEQGHRVLIFSQMTRVLNVLEEYLEGLGYRYERIDGNITGIQRQEAIDRFNSADCSHFIFLLSTRAGGLGINLATADTVIIYDSDWNPHNDIQAFSRAHRIGQKNKVMIYRFITRNSVEERMMQVAKKKMMLTHLVVRSDNEQGPKFNKQELDSIVKFGAEELFKEEESKDAIHYDDKAVEELLDRSNAGIEQKESVVNEYFNSFKVANYSTKGENDVDKSKPKQESDKTDPAYWGKLLGRHREDKPKRGVGRPSKHSDYVGDLECKEVLPKDTVYDTDESDSADEDERFDVELHNRKRRLAKQKKSKNVELNNKNKEDAKKNTNLVRKKVDVDRYIRRSKRATVLDKQEDTNIQAELLAGSENNTEVVGFNARQRKAFLHAIMRYGMPPQDSFNTQWLEKDLQCKSERNFRAYSTLFMRHLCEPCADDAKTFADGVPREGLSSRHVLTRIGIMCLIRKKVHEFESSYGIHSMPKSNSSETIVIDDVEDNPASNPPLPIDTHVILDSDEEILPDLVRVNKDGNDKSEPNNNRDIKDKKQMSPDIDDTDNVTNDVDLYSEQQVSVNKDPLKETVTSARDNLVKEKKNLERRTSTEAKAVKDNEAEKDCDRLIGNEERMLLEEGTSKEREISQKDLKLKVDTDKNGIDRRISVDGESLKQNEVDDKSENDLERKVSVDDDLKDHNRPEKDCDLEKCNQTSNCPDRVMSTKDDPLKDNDTSQKHCDLDVVEVETCLEQGMSIDSDPLTDNDNMSQKDCDLAKVDNCLEQGMSTDADPLTDDTSDDTSQKDCNLEFVAENCLDQELSIDDDPLKDNDMPQKDCDPKLYKAENCLKQELSNDSDPLKDNDLSPKNCDLELEKTENCLEQGMSIEDDPLEDTTEKDLVLAENSLKQGLIVDDNPKDNASENINPELLKDENVETPKYLFNIADGGFTELHTLWVNEERALVSGKEHATWHRTHDFWLLAGIVVHGYGRWLFLQNDPRFAIINEPFKADSCKTNFIEIRNRFLTRRFKLLEQALVIEEQLRRAAYLNLKQDPNHPAVARSRLPDVLNQLGDLLSDMKANVSRLPAALARNERVADRLKMSARVLMSRLADNPSPAAQTPKFPPGLGKLEQDISNYGPQYSVPVDGAPPTSD